MMAEKAGLLKLALKRLTDVIVVVVVVVFVVVVVVFVVVVAIIEDYDAVIVFIIGAVVSVFVIIDVDVVVVVVVILDFCCYFLEKDRTRKNLGYPYAMLEKTWSPWVARERPPPKKKTFYCSRTWTRLQHH